MKVHQVRFHTVACSCNNTPTSHLIWFGKTFSMSRNDSTTDDIVALVIDDNPSSLEARTSLLQDNGFRVIGTESFDLALRAFHKTSVDIIVTDINLNTDQPRDKGGINFARRIRSLNQKRFQ